MALIRLASHDPAMDMCGWLRSILRLGAPKRYAPAPFVEKIFAPGVERK